jgi:conjugal transfer pilin signal peptidase TrbI
VTDERHPAKAFSRRGAVAAGAAPDPRWSSLAAAFSRCGTLSQATTTPFVYADGTPVPGGHWSVLCIDGVAYLEISTPAGARDRAQAPAQRADRALRAAGRGVRPWRPTHRTRGPRADGVAFPRRRPWPRFLLRAGLALLLVLGTGAYLTERFRIGYDDQDRQCLPPHRWFLIDRHDRAITQGAVFAFAARGLGPYFRDGQTIIKRAAGVPGDRIEVGPETVRSTGPGWGRGSRSPAPSDARRTDFLRRDIVPPGHLWVMGATADSFDSRYWGFLPEAGSSGGPMRSGRAGWRDARACARPAACGSPTPGARRRCARCAIRPRRSSPGSSPANARPGSMPNPHPGASAAGEILGREQHERFRAGSARRLRLPRPGAALSPAAAPERSPAGQPNGAGRGCGTDRASCRRGHHHHGPGLPLPRARPS